MTSFTFLLILFLLCLFEWQYIRLARRLNLIDRPNERSSHTDFTTVRSGGLVFVLAAGAGLLTDKAGLHAFALGLVLVALVSFLDDLKSVPNRYRLAVQLLSTVLLIYQLDAFSAPVWIWFPVLIVGVGILNAYNFMDGINGITALYSLVTVGTLWYVGAVADSPALLPALFAGLLVFSRFNVRQKAVCFAGDVGSISLAFMILFALGSFMITTKSGLPLLFLTVYGIDSVLTIVYRIWLGQNIFQAHRLHLFHQLVDRRGWSHRRVSLLYAFMQLIINVLILWTMTQSVAVQFTVAASLLISLTILHTWVRQQLLLPYERQTWKHKKADTPAGVSA